MIAKEIGLAMLNAKRWSLLGKTWAEAGSLALRPEKTVSQKTERRSVRRRRKKVEEKNAKNEVERRKKGLVKNKKGKYVNQALSEKTKRSAWTRSIIKARTILGIRGWAPIRKESGLYKTAAAIHKFGEIDE